MPAETKPERLRRLIATIEAAVDHNVPALQENLTQYEKARFDFVGGAYGVRIATISATATPGYAHALRNWCAAARRALDKLEAA
jgi:hypothetical protein